MNQQRHEYGKRILRHILKGVVIGQIDEIDFIPPESANPGQENEMQANDRHRDAYGYDPFKLMRARRFKPGGDFQFDDAVDHLVCEKFVCAKSFHPDTTVNPISSIGFIAWIDGSMSLRVLVAWPASM